MFKFDCKIIHVDPVAKYVDYVSMPKADHFPDPSPWRSPGSSGLDASSNGTDKACAYKIMRGEVQGGLVMKNGDVVTVMVSGLRPFPPTTLFIREITETFFIPRVREMGMS